mmetsp:Transcript_5147/g.10654  ORF Transcript_5147/g.10654 Transcript_5147/m.10654 type:complete len:709 (-) Transcript_5147:102-2228(-)
MQKTDKQNQESTMPPDNSHNSASSLGGFTNGLEDVAEDKDVALGDNNPKDGIFLRWSRITKSVAIKPENLGLMRGSIAESGTSTRENFQTKIRRMSVERISEKKQVKTILDEVSGCAAPGEILAMMGPSGSGKTTLLNCLSGRNPYNSGVVSVNGHPLGGPEMKRLMAKIAYVKQADIFFEHLTVRDQLGYTAMLRLPQVLTKSKKMEEVDRIIRLLRLTKVSNSEIRMLSGGEKKRLNIGTELLTNPDVLLLDEPTSGLDSTSAVALMKMLRVLARTAHKTIITSIHQPSSALFASFDRLIMLAEGHVVYFGRPLESLNYLREQTLDCPDGYNAADHWMDLLVQDSAIDEEDDERANASSTVDDDAESDKNSRPKSMTKRQQLIEAWDKEAVAEQMDLSVKQEETKRLSQVVSLSKNEQQTSKYSTSWGLQYRVLVHRSLKNSRSAIFTPINLVKSCALGLTSGLLWFQMEYTESRVFDRSSYFFFTMTFWVFDAMFQSFLTFPTERSVVLKERASGSYQLSAYFMGKTTSEMPARLVLPLLYMIISFWMASISTKFSMFVATTFISLLSVMAGDAIGLLIGATIYDAEKGMTFMTVVSLFLALVGGFFVENVPPFLVWSKYISPFKYSFDASLQLVFDQPVPCDGSGALEGLCDDTGGGYASPEAVMEFLGVQGSVGFNVGVLIAIGLVPRYLAYLALGSKKEGDR